MSAIAIGVLASALLLGASQTADPTDANVARLTAIADDCIKTNAARVERGETSLADAAKFLVSYVCASEIGIRETYIRNSALLASYRAIDPAASSYQENLNISPEARQRMAQQTKDYLAALAQARVDPDSGEIIWPRGVPPSWSKTLGVIGSDNVPSDFRAAAGQAVLEAREARLKSQPLR